MPTKTPEKLTTSQVLKELKSLGTEQNRKTYARHGATGEIYGVSYANLYAIQKRIKVDHELALELWDSGISDARVLATLIADPAQTDMKLVKQWSKDVDNYGLAGAIASTVIKGPHAKTLFETWKDDKNDWRGQMAWTAVAAVHGETDAYYENLIKEIEQEIHSRPNRTRYSMLGALIGIGSINAKLKDKALAAAKRIGKVEVDHGDTYCKTPDALTAIEKTYAHRHRKSK